MFLAKGNGIADISCIVLVGGKSVRLGRDKAVEPLGAGILLERVLSRLSLFKRAIILVGREGQDFSRLPGFPKYRVIHDIYAGKGPLGGIYAGLTASTTLYNLVVAGDMPFLNNGLLNYMIKEAAGYDIAVPRFGNYFEPLHAVYSRNCLKTIETLLVNDELIIRKLFEAVRVRYIESRDIDRFDPKHLSFFNVNTEADLTKAKELIKENPS